MNWTGQAKKLNSALGMAVIMLAAANSQVWAQTPPSFPQCNTFEQPGDWVTADGGFHHIPGQEATIEGADDVYYIENGNFVQCLCPVDTSQQGVQTNWWNVEDVEQSIIDQYTNQGWFFEQGSDWNLMDKPYLVQNTTYTCHVPTPTPTPTVSITPSVTPTPGPTVPPPGNPPSNPPTCPDPQPETPTLLSVEKSGQDGVQLIWSEPDANVNHYIISYGYKSGEYNFGVPNTGKTTTYRIGSLDLSKTYYFVVRSQKGCAVSEKSNELSYPKNVQAAKLADTDSTIWMSLMQVMTVAGTGITVAGLAKMKLQ